MIRFWRIAVRLAWRDLLGWPGRSVFITLTMALSVASISGVRGAATVARRALQGDSRAWLAGDVGVDTTEPINETQARALDAAKSRQISWTLVTMASTMAASDQSPDPAFISVKAVDPAEYPFYGNLLLNPPQTLLEALQEDTAVVSEEVLERLQVRVGERILVAGREFRIVAQIQADPSRFSNDLGLGMRCILSREGFARTGIADADNSVRNRVLLRLPDSVDFQSGRQLLEGLFPGASLRDYRAGYRQQTESAITFLSLTALLALALGAIGIAVSVREHAEQTLPTLAVMKMLGARNAQVTSIFFLQIGIMAAVALSIGVPLGLFVEGYVLSLAGRYLVLPQARIVELATIAGTAGAALVGLAPVLVPPVLLIRRLRPAGVLRKDVEGRSEPMLNRGFFGVLAGGVSFLVIATLAYGLLRSFTSAVLIGAALLAGVGIAGVLTGVALSGLRRWTSADGARRTPLLRHGIAALSRPGNRSRMLIVSLSIALAVMITTFEASGVVVTTIFDMLPYDRNSLYIARFKDLHFDDLRAFLERQPGVESVEIISQTLLNLRKVDDGEPFELPTLVLCAPDLPRSGVLLAEDTARQFRARIGSRLTFEARDEKIHATVIAIRKLTPAERVWSNVKLDCSALDRRILSHQAVVRIAPDRISAVRRAVTAEYPTFAIITPEDVSGTVKAVSEDAMALARIVAWFAIGAELSVLVAIVAASRTARLREIGILAAVGARRRTILKLYTIEFAAIGAVSAAIGSALACGLTMVVIGLILRHVERNMIDWKPLKGGAFLSVMLIIVAGWLPIVRLLSRKPMDILRGE
jgi:putative ABC transport system permease protein